MSRSPFAFPALALATAGLVALCGAGIHGGEWKGPIALGAALAGLYQAGSYLLLTRLFPGRGMAVFGAGMFGHLVLLGAAMFVVVPLAGLQAGPVLLSLVTVLFATTTLEPIFLSAHNRKNV